MSHPMWAAGDYGGAQNDDAIPPIPPLRRELGRGRMLWRVRNSRGKPINAPNHLFTLDAYFGRRILYCE
jgi:hypothetical protein